MDTGSSEDSAHQAFLFADLAGFTALTEAHGDAEATEILEKFTASVREQLPRFDAELIKTMGDEVMVRLDDVDRAVELGLRIVEDRAIPGHPPVRVGIHCGPAIERSGDWFGATVNLASRVSGAARTGEVLLTEEAKQCATGDGFDVQERGLGYFKHIPGPVPIYRAVGPRGVGRHLEIDPVCRMAVDPRDPAATRRRRGITYYFCSEHCERAFAAQPRRYLAASPAARSARRWFFLNLGAFLAYVTFHVVTRVAGWADADYEMPEAAVFAGIWGLAVAFHYRAVRTAL